jgi:hypothetical protein
MKETEHSWDIEDINQSLRAVTEIAESVAYGKGVRFSIPDTGTSLDVYPQAQHIQILTWNFQVAMYRAKVAYIDERGVAFEGPEIARPERVWVAPNGDVTVVISSGIERPTLAQLLQAPKSTALASASATQLPQRAKTATESQNKPEMAPTMSESSLAAETASEALESPTEPDSGPTGKEKKEYIKLSGRVGRAPVFWTTRNGVPVARFPLGVHLEGDRTEWHTVKAWRALAEKARELKRGQLASVNGYLDYEVRRGADGKARRERIIRAAAILPK